MIEIVLPWPPKELSPNSRLHWSKKSKAAKQYRHACRLLTMAATRDWPVPDGDLVLNVTFIPPDRRHRDDDNLVASMKAGRDGIADALGINDQRFRTRPWISDVTTDGGSVRVTITGDEA